MLELDEPLDTLGGFRDLCVRLLSLGKEAPSHEQWLLDRGSAIGGSDAAAVVGVSKWKSPLRLWAEKSGRVSSGVESNDAMEMGKLLEPVILARLAEKSGRSVCPWPSTLIAKSDAHPFMACTPDGLTFDPAMGGTGIVQCKTTGEHFAHAWDGEPPLDYQVQVQHELAVTGLPWACLVVLIGGRRLKWIDILPNMEFREKLIEAERNLWSYVESGEVPPFSDDIYRFEDTKSTLFDLFSKDNGQAIVLPDEFSEVDLRLEIVKNDIKRLESEKESLENKIRQALGDCTEGVLPNGAGSYTWKTQHNKGYTKVVEPFDSRVLRRSKKGKK